MLQISVGPPLRAVVTLCYRANKPVLISGKHGVGKSQFFMETAKALGIQCIVNDLSLLDAPDLLGMPIITGGVTTYAPPKFLPTKGSGLLVFEELNRAPRQVRTPCLELLTARRLNDYRLPDGFLPCAAINPPDADGYQVDDLDPALESRFVKIHVVPDVRCWLAWAEEKGIHPVVRQFVAQVPQIFDAPQSNPRAWAYVSDVLVEMERGPYLPSLLPVAVEGLVGSKLAAAFCRFRAEFKTQPFSPEEIVHSYKSVRKKIQKLVTAGNTALIESVCHQMLLWLQVSANAAAAKKSAVLRKNLTTFRQDLPAEFRKKMVRHHAWLEA